MHQLLIEAKVCKACTRFWRGSARYLTKGKREEEATNQIKDNDD